MTAPNFVEMAREWLVLAQGHARAPHEESLAKELERVYELGEPRYRELLEHVLLKGTDGAILEALVAARKIDK